MQHEEVLNSFILRVVVSAQKKRYNLHDLRSGKIISFKNSQDLMDYVERSSTKHPPWAPPEESSAC